MINAKEARELALETSIEYTNVSEILELITKSAKQGLTSIKIDDFLFNPKYNIILANLRILGFTWKHSWTSKKGEYIGTVISW